METEKQRADRFEAMLDDSRKERDSECERLQQNIDSQKEQLDVSHNVTVSQAVARVPTYQYHYHVTIDLRTAVLSLFFVFFCLLSFVFMRFLRCVYYILE